MDPLRVFLSYRRDADYYRASMIRMIIEASCPPNPDARPVLVFQDTRQRLGVVWPVELRTTLAEADIVLAIIGPDWLAAKDSFERRRIDQDNDWVRQEIAYGLKSGKSVIPVVVGTTRPPRDALPDSIAKLADRQGVTIPEPFSDHDLQPVILEIAQQRQPALSRSVVQSGPRTLPYPDPPLKFKPTPLTDAEIDEALAEMLSGWEVARSAVPEEPVLERVELHKEYRFDSFSDVIDYMQQARPFIEEANHHPRWENIYSTLRVFLTTWDIGHRISYLDVMLAGHLDRTFAKSIRGLSDAG
jgi:pterin-4a-carbinolamine dehydratase